MGCTGCVHLKIGMYTTQTYLLILNLCLKNSKVQVLHYISIYIYGHAKTSTDYMHVRTDHMSSETAPGSTVTSAVMDRM